MDRVIEDGQVAVLVSPGFGAGWYSWHEVIPLLFDPVVVELVRTDRRTEIEAYVSTTYPDLYCGGVDDLVIEWVPVGERFRISEYDGSETLVLESEHIWVTA